MPELCELAMRNGWDVQRGDYLREVRRGESL